MKLRLVLLILVNIFWGECLSQTDTLILRVLEENPQIQFSKRTVPDNLKDSCNYHWKVKKSSWFRANHRGGKSKAENGNNSRNVQICYQTENYYVVYYLHYAGRGIRSRLFIYNKQLLLIGRYALDRPAISIEDLRSILRSNYFRPEL